ncbi:CDP-diacylglycerol--serine O-phosphatidyltransferase 1-like isoform X1 [Benincasa hispida]|uniref:CDP-diacylglycerol--serine O-phosphatidyltransferase 1-like isoform X1 n=3 Tax=Benincasa hispida TaxID=102211 RepID=UPI0018FFB2AF|nr:CDP-diacylglycerol--serine O-phosphatidyltransferase 1-like isoform X1 [Benincasa hispida]XP_038892336.1 CDP-diacylglycerol--serine O-phosphatidyltransferase 1-like isoform X1 [Benincasa hispida]XP_038892337.1 CDP-diacylglycerol--serine O-phosphatidyltransferase 1-like isoform X1 [Benincasa hispida]XP_038892338.1 CDP-diacylglycerol--serine O-phosphatidyltransferase 1-like isoform X1 [Benincasa hispida]XP_038892339.1 CDP-diacylglycerol--serine O-phosphatidyltransferase 1-like isoform X1 [Beni
MELVGPRRVNKKNYLIRENGDSLLSNVDDLDPWTAWAYRPRTVTLLLLGACFLITMVFDIYSFGLDSNTLDRKNKGRALETLFPSACWASGALDPECTASSDLVTSVKRGVWAMIAVFLTYCLLQAPSTILIRPHPAVWRLVHGLAVIYLVALTFLLFQKRDDAREFMKFLHPDLGLELPERSYGTDCRIFVPENPTSRFKNVYATLFDEFVPAHIIGWWGKAILIRNQPLLWVLSIGFELMELTFRHMLPNFNECWWDSIILDILICNWFGIWAGMRTVRYFDGKTYKWVGLSRQPNIIGKSYIQVKRTLGQFTPAQWDKDEWHPLLGPWRFIQVLALCIVFLTVELNTFFLKYCLWVPPRNPVIVYRLVLWWLIAIPTMREYNVYLQDRKPVKKIGAFCWLSLAICVVELLICVKFGHGLYPKPMPSWLVQFWITVGVSLVLFLLIWTWQLHQLVARKKWK